MRSGKPAPSYELRGVSSPERTLTQRELAALRPAVETPRRQPRPDRAPSLREVTSGIVCFCGERFNEAQALEFMLHLRAEVGETLSWAERKKQLHREQERRRWKNPAVRERQLKQHREYQARPEVKEKRREYQARPEVKERRRQYEARKRAARKAASGG